MCLASTLTFTLKNFDYQNEFAQLIRTDVKDCDEKKEDEREAKDRRFNRQSATA